MLVKGISQLHLDLFLESPSPSLHQSQSGGFLDPIVGTFIVTAIGIAIAAPVGVGIATWLTEYAHPRWLARAVESGIETIAGVPSIVLALFGLLVFARGFFSFLSASASNGSVSGRSFLIAGGRRVSMVFEQPNPFPMSIFDNIAYALVEQRSARNVRRRRRTPEIESAIVEALRRAGLYHEIGGDLERPALKLSGSQQRRLCIARARRPAGAS